MKWGEHMRLNPDCLRDLLLELENDTNGFNIISYTFVITDTEVVSADFKCSDKYSANEIYYHLKQCEYSGFFIRPSWYLSSKFSILDISPEAHKFIENIRSQSTWEKVKSIAAKVGSFSIEVLKQIATSLAISGINSLLNN